MRKNVSPSVLKNEGYTMPAGVRMKIPGSGNLMGFSVKPWRAICAVVKSAWNKGKRLWSK